MNNKLKLVAGMATIYVFSTAAAYAFVDVGVNLGGPVYAAPAPVAVAPAPYPGYYYPGMYPGFYAGVYPSYYDPYHRGRDWRYWQGHRGYYGHGGGWHDHDHHR